MFGKKKKLDEKALTYIKELNNYVDSCKNDNELNLMFTEVTILRMRLDVFDSLLTNLRDARKRKEVIDKKSLIKVQIYDICESYSVFGVEEKKSVDLIMKKILPQKESKSFWVWIGECIDNATGKH